MKHLKYVFLFIISTSYCYGDDKCGPNEQLNTCPSACSTGRCPKSNNESKNCSNNDQCLKSRCDCQFNYRRADNGTCTPIASCPEFECPENEVYNSCPSFCPTDDCSQVTADGSCPYPWLFLIVLECSPACRCMEGYCRKDGVCVPCNECPK